MPAAEKLSALKEVLRESRGAVIAFSGGLDSTLLAVVAADVLGERALAATALSPLFPAREQQEARQLARQLGLRHVTLASDELRVEGFAENPPHRCYLCKKTLFSEMLTVAARHGLPVVMDGTNKDDRHDYRPGRRAAQELGIRSPLLEAGLDKQDIRALSRALNLPTAGKAPFACLASRFPYGTRISAQKLRAVDAVEEALHAAGFRQFRARCHGDTVRIEVEVRDLERLCRDPCRSAVVHAARKAGFTYVATDMQGYRSGSLNEVLPDARRERAPGAS